VISWNKPLEDYSGILQSDVVGTTDHWRAFYPEKRACLADFLVDNDFDSLAQYYGGKVKPSSLGAEAFEGIDLIPYKDEPGRWLHFTATVIRDIHGTIIGAVETIEDITERRRMDEELRKSRDELEARVADRTKELALLNTSLQAEVESRKRIEGATRKANEETERLMASMSSFLIALDLEQRVTRWNAAAEIVFGLPASKVIGCSLGTCGIRWDWNSIVDKVPEWPLVEKTVRLPEVRYEKADGSAGFLSLTVDVVKSDEGMREGCFVIGMDVTDRRNLEVQLLHAQKLESVGQLAAGIAHEINTPTQYVGDNIEFLQIAYQEFAALIAVLRELAERRNGDEELTATLTKARELIELANVDYLMEQIPRAIEQSIEGIGRVSSIVQAMKEFSHPGTEEKSSVDLNQCILSTVTVSRNEWKYVADLNTDLDEDLPLVMSLPGEFNQVVLNMIVNAAHAIEEATHGSGRKGEIVVRSRQHDDYVEIDIGDTGCGIPDEIRERIFDPFFTTKEVGRGTGQGLAIARHVVVDKLGGTISLESKVGEGTTFTIRLPIS
jgi:PAS domain S-box-containing protein